MKKRFLGLLAICCGFLGTSLTNSKNFSNSNESADICTEYFENQTSSTDYKSQITYKKEDSSARLGWFVEHGCVSTSTKISGSKSMHMRAYYSKTSPATEFSDVFPYCNTTTPINNVKYISFKAKTNVNTTRMYVQYSTNLTTWNNLANDVKIESEPKTYSYSLPRSYVNNLYLRIGVDSSSTHPTTGSALYLIIDDVNFKTPEDSTVSLTNATPVGGYYKDENGNKKQFVSFGATIAALPEKDLSLVTEYGINVYSDESCSTLVTTKSATIGSGGHTIDELKGQGGRFYTILSSEDGIVNKTKYYAIAYVKESSGASSESETVMSAEASTSGKEYEI